jgi:hypothetical protein
LWPVAALPECLLFRRCQGTSRHAANGSETTLDPLGDMSQIGKNCDFTFPT